MPSPLSSAAESPDASPSARGELPALEEILDATEHASLTPSLRGKFTTEQKRKVSEATQHRIHILEGVVERISAISYVLPPGETLDETRLRKDHAEMMKALKQDEGRFTITLSPTPKIVFADGHTLTISVVSSFTQEILTQVRQEEGNAPLDSLLTTAGFTILPPSSPAHKPVLLLPLEGKVLEDFTERSPLQTIRNALPSGVTCAFKKDPQGSLFFVLSMGGKEHERLRVLPAGTSSDTIFALRGERMSYADLLERAFQPERDAVLRSQGVVFTIGEAFYMQKYERSHKKMITIENIRSVAEKTVVTFSWSEAGDKKTLMVPVGSWDESLRFKENRIRVISADPKSGKVVLSFSGVTKFFRPTPNRVEDENLIPRERDGLVLLMRYDAKYKPIHIVRHGQVIGVIRSVKNIEENTAVEIVIEDKRNGKSHTYKVGLMERLKLFGSQAITFYEIDNTVSRVHILGTDIFVRESPFIRESPPSPQVSEPVQEPSSSPEEPLTEEKTAEEEPQRVCVTEAERSLFACVARSKAVTEMLKRSGIQSVPGREDVLLAGNAATWDMFYMAAYIYSDNNLDIIENVAEKTFTVVTNVLQVQSLRKEFTVLTPETPPDILRKYFPVEEPASLNTLMHIYEEATGSPIGEFKHEDVFHVQDGKGKKFTVRVHRAYTRATDSKNYASLWVTHGNNGPYVDHNIPVGGDLKEGYGHIRVLTADPVKKTVRLFFVGYDQVSREQGERIHALSGAHVVDWSPMQPISILRRHTEAFIGTLGEGRCFDMDRDGKFDAVQLTFTDGVGHTAHEHFHLNKPRTIFRDVTVTVVRIFGENSARLTIDGPGILARNGPPLATTLQQVTDREPLAKGNYYIFGDGSAGTAQVGAWAYRIEKIEDRSAVEEVSDFEGGISSGEIQRMELKAIAKALERIPAESTVHVYCDNDYVRLGIDVLKGKSDAEIRLWHQASMVRERIRNIVLDTNRDLWEKIVAALARGVMIEYHPVTASRGGTSHRRCHNLANSRRRLTERMMGRR